MKSAFVARHKGRWCVKRMCMALGISRSGYYAWSHRGQFPSRRQQQDAQLTAQIQAIFTCRHGCYGSPRIRVDLSELGVPCGRKRVARLMRQAGLIAVPRRRTRRPSLPGATAMVVPDRVGRQFTVLNPNVVWVVDITYISTREGWLYLAIVMDLYSRRIVGWAMAPTLSASLGERALRMALENRSPAAGLIHHSDHGAQYVAKGYQELLAAHGIIPSMSRPGNCWDNAVAESFFHSLKGELVHRKRYATRREAQADIFDYIEVFYNRQRRHSHLGNLAPVLFEKGERLSTQCPQ